ncbi:unnamed protein product [Rhizophagus irregularis]|uniref:Uncharacterized protein n=1 Tax=Rhizophagus irregularis TaxID=588596 RepID=A0A915ZFX6_9GLOM|nr:unnamed protein product [Rhizophagus irregularis]
MTSKTTSKVSSKHNRAPYERSTQEEIKKYQNAATPAATQQNIEDIQSKSQLCNILIEFIIKMRPVNKQYYSSESIYNCVSALNRYFQNHSAIAPLDLFSEPVFKPLLNVVHSKMRENEQLNSLDIKKGADPLTEDEQKQILSFKRPDGGYNFIIIHEKNNQGGLNSRRKKGKTNQPRILSYHLMNLEQLMDLAMTYQNICVYDLKMQNPTFIYGPLVILKKLMKTYSGVNAYRMPNEKQMMEVTKKAFPARSNPSIVGKSSTLNTTRSSEFTRNSPISIEVVSKEEHCKSIIGLKSTSTKEIESTKVTKRDKFKTPFKGKFRSPLIDLNKKVPSDDSQSSQNMTLDLEGMKVHITNCNVTINISKN